VTVAGLGTLAGAVYKPLFEIPPYLESPAKTSGSSQVTAVFVVFETVAVNCCCPPTGTLAVVGATLTVIGSAGGGVAAWAAVAVKSGSTDKMDAKGMMKRRTAQILRACSTIHFS
jgi:hypothetical protein